MPYDPNQAAMGGCLRGTVAAIVRQRAEQPDPRSKLGWKRTARLIGSLSILAGGWGFVWGIPGEGWLQATAKVRNAQAKEISSCGWSSRVGCRAAHRVEFDYVFTVAGKDFTGWSSLYDPSFVSAIVSQEAGAPPPEVSVWFDPEVPARSFEASVLAQRRSLVRGLYAALVCLGILAFLATTGASERRRRGRSADR